jgi:GNAT superfamily N-acetyltransferase
VIETHEDYRIIPARPGDLSSIAEIELAAARLLTGHAPESVLAETTDVESLEGSRRSGRLWVALAGDVPVGFARVVLLEPEAAHLDEIDVHPHHGRRGIGRELVTTVLEWAAATGFRRGLDPAKRVMMERQCSKPVGRAGAAM